MLQHLDVAQQFHRLFVADVVDPVRGHAAAGRVGRIAVPGRVGARRAVQRADHAFDDVIDIGEAALVFAVVEHLDRLAGQDRAGEQEQRHVRPAPGPVHGEKPQSGAGNAVQVGVAVRHRLVGLLAGRVQGQWVVGALVFGERHRGVGAVHRAGGGEHQVFDAVVAAAFEHVQEAGDVAGHVYVRVLRGVAHAGLGGQVHHPLRLVGGEGGVDGGAVGQVGGDVGVARVVAEARQPCLFQSDVVVVVEVVDAHHFVAAFKQALGQVGTDEAGGAGDEDFHGHSRPSTAVRGRTYLTSNSTQAGLPNARMPSAPRARNCSWPTATMIAS